MLALAAQALLALAVAAFAQSLLEPPDKRPWPRRAATFVLLAAFCAQALGWCWAWRAPSPLELAPALSRPELAVRFAAAGALGLAAFLSVGRNLAPLGLATGLLFALLGSQALVWLGVLRAWRLMGLFAGVFFAPAVPIALAVSLAAAAFFLLHAELRPRRWQAAAALLLLWAIPGRLALWRLKTHWSLGAPTLAADAGLPPLSSAPRVSVAWLYPSGGRGYRFEEKQAIAAGTQASPESLEKIDAYLRRRDFRSVFAPQALSALRQGWLFWWEADRALDAAALSRPGRFAPDYKTALGLLRAGQVTEERYQKLQALAEQARPRREGFEDVNTSQIIFESFASAFARFGDEEPAREWLFRVDDLWPIYDKKIEVSPLETMHDGRIEGDVLLGGKPALGFKVGLFFVAASTSASSLSGLLSRSEFPDQNGRFRFDALAPGMYYLGLMGEPSQLRGRVLNPPGLFELSAEVPALMLDPVRVEH